jgi:hypothetical protein
MDDADDDDYDDDDYDDTRNVIAQDATMSASSTLNID